MMKTGEWELERFDPSDGTMIANAPMDHRAWLRGNVGGERVHMLVQFSSRGVDSDTAEDLLIRMIGGLNDDREYGA